MKRITIADVAKLAGVSKSTVSQYLNHRFDYMGADTKQKIEKAIQQLNYKPNMVARSLKQKSSTTIGVIVANILHVFSTQVIRAIEDFCQEKGFHVIVCNADDQPEKEKKYIEMLRAKQVDGVIAFPTGDNVELYQKLLEEDYPVVLMDRIIPSLDIPSILLDNRTAAQLAVAEIVQQGFQRPAVVSSPLTAAITPRIERVESFQRSLQEHGLELLPSYKVSGKMVDLTNKLAELFQNEQPPDVLFAINDRVLHEVLTFIKQQGLRIPEEVAVISIDDVSFANFYNPPLTTISQPAFDMGKKAAEILFECMVDQKEEKLQVYRFPPTLNKRESC
ncbi:MULTISPECIES: LacI family DNA-binding transcriptional regulator [Gracilibacillus]|uniref:LacI family DNA-binding transcriptional regulator n=1 Tax=Gracilibacillus TaxID=74385 RepID=UPI000824467F|nr:MULTISPECIES: substrate-binding domain-containing protein [Gracilibacillus]